MVILLFTHFIKVNVTETCQCVLYTLYVLVLHLINVVFLWYSSRHMFDIVISCTIILQFLMPVWCQCV